MKKKPLPTFKTDVEAEDFVETADLTDYDLTGGVPIRYEFKPKTANISMRVPQELLDAVKAAAEQEGIPYQRFIRQALENVISKSRRH